LQELINTKNESDLLFADQYPDFSVTSNIINLPSVFHANITEATPGTIIGLNFANGQGIVSVEIGGTGAYYIQANESPLISISLIDGQWDGAKFTFNYYDDTPVNAFSKVAKLSITDEIRQFIGTGYDINIIDSPRFNLQDIRRELRDFHYIKVMKRQIENIYKIGNYYYFDDRGTDLIRDKDWNPVLIYYDAKNKIYFDGHKDRPMDEPPDYRFKLNSQDAKDYMDVTGIDRDDDGIIFGDTFGRVEAIRNISDVDELRVGTGVLIDVAYRVRITEYVVESTEMSVARAKEAWLDAVKYVDAVIASPHMTFEMFDLAVNEAKKMYEIYLTKLNLALNK